MSNYNKTKEYKGIDYDKNVWRRDGRRYEGTHINLEFSCPDCACRIGHRFGTSMYCKQCGERLYTIQI